ncbi:hypothetical protein [Desulfocicer vacuolatum]|uniref:hypothetical protein n=1 Tax=Desulfocicer vacuolatum TaxID=2298 RepID=UPI001BAF7BB0|nr:hypothetical protein [Desulfocicer vacuolatum]
MKYSANQRCISSFVVGRTRSVQGPPVAVIYRQPKAEPPPPTGNRNRTIELSTVPVRDHCPSGERRYNTIWLRVYDPIFIVGRPQQGNMACH